MNEPSAPTAIESRLSEIENAPSVPRAVVFGAVAAAIGAGVWAGIAYLTNYQIGWIAIGVGFLAGLGVRVGGRGAGVPFGIVGALLAALGVGMGNLGMVLLHMNREFHTIDIGIAMEVLKQSTGFMDVLFYGLAVWTGWNTGKGASE